MFKRYGQGSDTLSTRGTTTVKGPAIVERPDGDYYKASEVDAYLESIGAGGVDRQLFKKSLEEHRAEFEIWAGLHHGLCITPGPSVYYSHLVGWMWQAWMAAKGIKQQKD